MDNNQRIGIALIFLVFIGYYFFFAPKDLPQPQTADSTATATNRPVTPAAAATPFGALPAAADSAERTIELKNKDLAITFTTDGGRVKQVRLLEFTTFKNEPLDLVDPKRSRIQLTTASDSKVSVPFSVASQTANKVTFVGQLGGATVEQTYELPAEGYVVNYTVRSQGAAKDLSLRMYDDVRQTEKDLAQNRNNSTVNFYTREGDYDNLGDRTLELTEKSLADPLSWVSLKSQFFNIGLIAPNGLLSAKVSSSTDQTKPDHVKVLSANVALNAADIAAGKGNFQFYFGPNRFQLLKTVTEGYEKNVYLGYPVISWINRYITVNVFRFLESFIGNYGVIIFLLVILLRIVLFPLAYRSYISMAKMKVLKPEIDAIKEKNGDDMAAQQAEQMKLFQQVGINPISGCIPLLLQMPILLAMFNFFPNSIELRHQALWWAEDLSTYDSIATLPFSLPGYGSHVSLFTILMTASTLLVTWYNNQTSTVTGPMQSISYVMPVMFMFFLNSFPAGLNFYYLCSNLVSFAQQVLIRQSVDEASIRAKLESNRIKNADKKPSGFQARLAEAMRQAEEAKRADKKKGK